ncbi:serine hydrolase domain-containing protein [Sphaerisporangium rubeum]|uniref:CubicO group peptidase (Beta-lactamase class C family) n=1 Tax=Sphaerisporangium rubeum TaxID=321317 RepID=A0A7X0IHD4_9ACTN|nr:serine hydrolase domain-containing protein [Sphaerisporangium rubeum]MBB6475207.1 CubicO group peptidase (beta-lactamase class C family) [Sphaerisporangium rubeum]
MTGQGPTKEPPVQGYADSRFLRVRDAFEHNFATGEELGAAFAVYLDGEPVVDLWGGVADRHTGRPWQRDTPVLTYSCTKAITATVLLRLAEQGAVDVTAPVAEVWPQFAAAGKSGVTVEHLLTHQAGLPVLEQPVPPEDFGDLPGIAARLAAQPPLWAPGTAHGYHALTYGFLVGEVVRRVAGTSVGELVADEIAGPGGLEIWLGAPDDVVSRAARLSAGDRFTRPAAKSRVRGGPMAVSEDPGPGGDPRYAAALAALDTGSLMNRAMGNPNPNLLKGGANHPLVMAAGWPAMGLVTTAPGLAAFYRDLVAGELLGLGTLRDAVRRRVRGPDRVLMLDSSFGLGYMRPALTYPVPGAARDTAFGHTGLGGSLGLGDTRHGLGMAYTMNRLSQVITGSMRAYRLVEAVYRSLGRD